jgi:hypothetical protein
MVNSTLLVLFNRNFSVFVINMNHHLMKSNGVSTGYYQEVSLRYYQRILVWWAQQLAHFIYLFIYLLFSINLAGGKILIQATAQYLSILSKIFSKSSCSQKKKKKLQKDGHMKGITNALHVKFLLIANLN